MTLVQNKVSDHLVKTYNQSVPSGLHQGLGKLGHQGILGRQNLQYFETEHDEAQKSLWCYMRPPGLPIVTQGLLNELAGIQDQVKGAFGAASSEGKPPLSFFVFASRAPGVFNLGGDLRTFVECVKAGNRQAIHHYARSCIDIVHQNTTAFGLPIVTVALVQGDALGGGFETAMSFDVLVAERSAKFCLPEILFNLFPGMGAYSFLSRRLDAARAERLINSGSMMTAEALHEMGIVDVLAEDGQGHSAVQRYIAKESARLNARLAIHKTRRRINPITYEELRDVVDVWTDAVFNLSDVNLRMMERLASAQAKRLSLAVSV